jgi:hypothetical protein
VNTLKSTAVLLTFVVGIIHLYYGYAVAGSFGNIYSLPYSDWYYLMGVIYLVGATGLASGFMTRIFEILTLLFALILIGIFLAMAVPQGFADNIGYIDKVLEVVLIANLAVLLFRPPKAMAAKA